MTAHDVYFAYLDAGTDLALNWLEALVTRPSELELTTQPVEGATYYSKSSLDFSRPFPDLRKTPHEVILQLRALTFPEYQRPILNDRQIVGWRVLPSRSVLKAGTLTPSSSTKVVVSTIDYDIEVTLGH